MQQSASSSNGAMSYSVMGASSHVSQQQISHGPATFNGCPYIDLTMEDIQYERTSMDNGASAAARSSRPPLREASRRARDINAVCWDDGSDADAIDDEDMKEKKEEDEKEEEEEEDRHWPWLYIKDIDEDENSLKVKWANGEFSWEPLDEFLEQIGEENARFHMRLYRQFDGRPPRKFVKDYWANI